jgi:hypothetical protein
MGLDYSASNSLAIAYASNGLPSLSGSAKVVIDTSGNVGIGVTPTSNWHANATALQISPIGAIWNTSNYEDFNIGNNVYTDGTEKYIQNDAACKIRLTDSGLMDFRVAGAGTAGNTISFTTALAIEATGNTFVGKGFAVRGTQVPSYGSGIEMHQSGNDMHIYAYDRDNSAVKNLSLQNPGGAVLVGSTTNLNVLSGTPMLQIGAGTGHSSLQFYSATGSVGALYFGDATAGNDRYDGYLEYRHNSREMAFRAGGATVLTLRGNNAHGTGHNVDYGEHQHDVGEGVGVGEFYTQVAGSSFTDQFRINFDNPSWGGVTVDIRLNPNSSAGASVWVQYTIYSHVAHASANISAKDISGEGTGYINWVQESAGNLKCQLKTQYVTDDASARITYQMNHRGSQSIYLEEI